MEENGVHLVFAVTKGRPSLETGVLARNL